MTKLFIINAVVLEFPFTEEFNSGLKGIYGKNGPTVIALKNNINKRPYLIPIKRYELSVKNRKILTKAEFNTLKKNNNKKE